MKSPFITMSAVTGTPTRDEIYAYLLSLKECRIEQVLIYPRSGCEIEYLSEKWFETVGYFIDSAKALDMLVWLYDDFNWPSGDAGGRVTKIPEYRLQAIATSGENAGEITAKSSHNSGLFGEKYFPNLLLPEAVDYFIKCTHEEYYKRFSSDFGTVIKGFFTDEPSIGYCCHDGCIPYYSELKKDYFDACGRDFDTDMRTQGKAFYKNAITVVAQRFKSCYLDKIAAWCADHGVLMTGHLMCDHNPIDGITHSGHVLKSLSTFTLPGIDEIYTNFDDICEMSLLATAEYASGENGAMAELFALGPCDMSYTKKRAMLYLCACHKIDHYFLAISHMDMRGNLLVKDFFNTFSADQPDFIGMKELAKEAINAACIAKRDYAPDLYVRYPFALGAEHLKAGINSCAFLDVINALTKNQIQWKYTDKEEADAPTIEFNDNLCFTVGGKPFDISTFPHKLTVTDKCGNAPSGIFVRKFNDGTFVFLNLFSEDTEFVVNGKAVHLEKYGVYFLNEEENCKQKNDIFPVFDVAYGNPNVIRAMFLNDTPKAEIICEDERDVQICVRSGVEAILNGEKMSCTQNAMALPHGMQALYKCSDTIPLKKGKHSVLANNDFKYMPSILLTGDFTADIKSDTPSAIILKKRTATYTPKEKIFDFGKLEFTAKITLPKGATQIELSDTELYTQVYINGELLGERSFAPYKYDVPKNLDSDEVELKIVQYSSIAPIFGDVDYWDKNVLNCGWRGTPSPSFKPFGFNISICF